MKTSLCEEKGIRLIHIFEDEWLHKKEIVKSRLKSILNLIPKDNIIYGRKCTIKEINSKTKNIFLEENHIQGKDSSVVKIGAYYNDNLVAVMTFNKGNISRKGNPSNNEDKWELNRFCSLIDHTVIGIADKMLNYFKKNYKWKKIYSYADRRWSDGNLYEKLGFTKIATTGPMYSYVDTTQVQRIHRYNLRKRENEPKDISERELRLKEGYKRIWDCGVLKYELVNNTWYNT